MKRNPEPAVKVRVDPTNPGQFFACCGLLELADRLWGGAEGWFEDREFCLDAKGKLPELLAMAKAMHLSNESDDRTTLDEQEEEDDKKDESQDENNALDIVAPICLHLDWWKDKSLKTWAGSMNAVKIFISMCNAIDPNNKDPLNQRQVVFDPILQADKSPTHGKPKRPKKREPFYFDALRGANALPIDVGFSPDAVKITPLASPVVEALCFIGLQRCRPMPANKVRIFDYHTWAVPLDTCLAPVAVCGLLPQVYSRGYRFENAFRTDQKKHKAFTPATPLKGENDE